MQLSKAVPLLLIVNTLLLGFISLDNYGLRASNKQYEEYNQNLFEGLSKYGEALDVSGYSIIDNPESGESQLCIRISKDVCSIAKIGYTD